MKKAVVQWLLFLLIVYAAVVLTGCATVEKNRAAKAEDVLIAAGFTINNPPTTEDQADLQRFKPLKVTETTKDGQTVYVYPDPYHCQCVYVGDENQYAEYQRLLEEQKIASGTLSRATMYPGLPSDSDWGWAW